LDEASQWAQVPSVGEQYADRSFVDGLGTDPHDAALKKLHCRRAQGFYLARPMVAGAVTRLIEQEHRGRVD